MNTKLTKKQQQTLNNLMLARNEVWDYYKQYKNTLPDMNSVDRDEIVNLILSGAQVDQAFKQVVSH